MPLRQERPVSHGIGGDGDSKKSSVGPQGSPFTCKYKDIRKIFQYEHCTQLHAIS